MSNQRLPPPPHVAYIEERYAAEPYRLVLSLIAADLADASRIDMTAHLLQSEPYQARIKIGDLLQPVGMISRRTTASLVRNEIKKVRRQLHIFGPQSMRLDIRPESSRFTPRLPKYCGPWT